MFYSHLGTVDRQSVSITLLFPKGGGEAARTYTASPKTDCKLAFLAQQQFLLAVQETPMFALKVMKRYSERLNRLAHRL
jgi:CRP-like cAMP-binding protein